MGSRLPGGIVVAVANVVVVVLAVVVTFVVVVVVVVAVCKTNPYYLAVGLGIGWIMASQSSIQTRIQKLT